MSSFSGKLAGPVRACDLGQGARLKSRRNHNREERFHETDAGDDALLCLFICLEMTAHSVSAQAAHADDQEFAKRRDLLKQKQYADARAALEAGIKKIRRMRRRISTWPRLVEA
ncbi:MAG: hypothetical protein ACREJN_04385 [Nitrospiraceae bacterium]